MGIPTFKKSLSQMKVLTKGTKKTIKGPKQLLVVVLGNRFLKDEQFRVLEPADSEQIGRLEEGLSTLEENLKNAKSLIKADKFHKFKEFYEKHCVSRTYFFQVRKFSVSSCTFHKPLRGDQNIDVFPDPEPYEEEGVTHYRPGSDPEEKYLPSKLEDPERRAHNIPFSPSAQTAKNVGFIIRCEQCKKPRLLQSRRKLSAGESKVLKRFIKFSFVSGSVFI